VSAFFAGLALGGTLFGRWVDRLARPCRLYALLELGIAVLGVAVTLALAHAALPFTTLEERLGPLAWGLPFALVGVPAVLMGGTLPMLVRSLAPQPGHIGAPGGWLYAANTAGAIAGALLTPFVLIPLLGGNPRHFQGASSRMRQLAAFYLVKTVGRAKPLPAHTGHRHLLSMPRSVESGILPCGATEREGFCYGARRALIMGYAAWRYHSPGLPVR
jgi:MFS family permease